MIATIKKGLLNKNMSLSIIVVLRWNFLKTFIKITILGKIYQCNTFGRLKMSTLIPSRFKNETNDALKLFGCNDNHQQVFFKQKMFLSMTAVLNIFIKIAILDKLYQCNSCYLNFEQHLIKYLCVDSSTIMQLFSCKKLALTIVVLFHKIPLLWLGILFVARKNFNMKQIYKSNQ